MNFQSILEKQNDKLTGVVSHKGFVLLFTEKGYVYKMIINEMTEEYIFILLP